jgi:hypothetical protein
MLENDFSAQCSDCTVVVLGTVIVVFRLAQKTAADGLRSYVEVHLARLHMSGGYFSPDSVVSVCRKITLECRLGSRPWRAYLNILTRSTTRKWVRISSKILANVEARLSVTTVAKIFACQYEMGGVTRTVTSCTASCKPISNGSQVRRTELPSRIRI